MYYIEVEETLPECLDRKLAKDGLIVCVIAGEDAPMKRFFKQFNFKHFSIQPLVDIVAKNGWRHEVYHPRSTRRCHHHF